MINHPGARLRAAINIHKPLVLAGVINAYSALLAEKAGIRAIYLSGAGVAASCFGLPDLGLTSLEDIVEETRRITSASEAPLVVDIDTGWGSPLMVARTIKALQRAGAAAVHIEDQPFEKRCGHREGKRVISVADMVARLKAAVEAKEDPSFYLIARTDALAIDDLEKTIDRINAYAEAGADAIFVEAITDLSQCQTIKKNCKIPLVINLTEFGKTPLWSAKEVGAAGADMVLFPLSVFRVMSQAALKAYQMIDVQGSTKELLPLMQSRDELYQFLNYEHYEKQMNQWLDRGSTL